MARLLQYMGCVYLFLKKYRQQQFALFFHSAVVVVARTWGHLERRITLHLLAALRGTLQISLECLLLAIRQPLLLSYRLKNASTSPKRTKVGMA